MRNQRSYSFGAAMYAWPFLVGVARYIQDNDLLHEQARLYAISAGSMPAVLLACGVDVERGLAAGLICNDTHRAGAPYLQPAIVRRSLDTFTAVLPPDAHVRASGRLFIAVTELPWFRKRVLSHFPTRGALLDALAGTMAIPGHGVWVAYRPRESNVGWCLDGGVSGPLNEDDRQGWQTVRVGVGASPSGLFSRPRYADLFPSRPVPLRLRFTVAPTEHRMGLYRGGYQDAAQYFRSAA